MNPDFWIALLQIIWINIILSGDNAVVIALAARSLPPEQQRRAVAFGSGAAIILRVALTLVAALLLSLPYLQILGGALLLYIGAKLLMEEEGEEEEGARTGSLLVAIRTILIADLIMSLDNVIAVALAATVDGHTNYILLIVGLAISIPIVIFCSTLMIKAMARFPIIVVIGAALIGWVAGDAIAHDPALTPFVHGALTVYAFKVAGAAIVLFAGFSHKWKTAAA